MNALDLPMNFRFCGSRTGEAKFYRGIIKGQEPEGEGDANAAPKLRLMDDIDDVPALEAGSGLSGPAAAAISHADAPSTRQDAVEVLRPPDRHVPSSSSAAPSAVRSQPKQRSDTSSYSIFLFKPKHVQSAQSFQSRLGWIVVG